MHKKPRYFILSHLPCQVSISGITCSNVKSEKGKESNVTYSNSTSLKNAPGERDLNSHFLSQHENKGNPSEVRWRKRERKIPSLIIFFLLLPLLLRNRGRKEGESDLSWKNAFLGNRIFQARKIVYSGEPGVSSWRRDRSKS